MKTQIRECQYIQRIKGRFTQEVELTMVMGLMGQDMETIKIFLLHKWLYSDSWGKKLVDGEER